MNTEQTAILRNRAGVHAALADVTRLRITDLLALSDRSASELGAALDVPSNLLAHHLNVLERAGLITRHRSEADRRRSYVRLVADGLEPLAPTPVGDAERVVFVCTANSARSQLAAALWQQASRIPVASAGTHQADRVDPGAIEVARRHGLDFTPLSPVQLDSVRLDGDLIITAGNDGQCVKLCAVLGLHELVDDPRFARNQDRTANRDALRPLLVERLATRTKDEWFRDIIAAGVPCGPINTIDAGVAFATEIGLDPVVEIGPAGHAVPSVRNPITFSDSAAEYRLPPPGLDEHGAEIRAWLEGPTE